MKKIVLVLGILLIATFAHADRWCEWSGTEGENCVNDRYGILKSPTGTPTWVESNTALINSWGLFKTTDTQPTIGEDQVRDAEVWAFADNEITRTWTVRDMTTTEIDVRSAGPMPLSEYYLWLALTHETLGIYTRAQLAGVLPQELIDAFLARDRLENP